MSDIFEKLDKLFKKNELDYKLEEIYQNLANNNPIMNKVRETAGEAAYTINDALEEEVRKMGGEVPPPLDDEADEDAMLERWNSMMDQLMEKAKEGGEEL